MRRRWPCGAGFCCAVGVVSVCLSRRKVLLLLSQAGVCLPLCFPQLVIKSINRVLPLVYFFFCYKGMLPRGHTIRTAWSYIRPTFLVMGAIRRPKSSGLGRGDSPNKFPPEFWDWSCFGVYWSINLPYVRVFIFPFFKYAVLPYSGGRQLTFSLKRTGIQNNRGIQNSSTLYCPLDYQLVGRKHILTGSNSPLCCFRCILQYSA